MKMQKTKSTSVLSRLENFTKSEEERDLTGGFKGKKELRLQPRQFHQQALESWQSFRIF